MVFARSERARAERCHLYNVWAALQAAELRAREKTGDPRLNENTTRKDFAGREAGADPWYDGNAFEATILDTPRRGSALPAGRQSDLSDDPVAQIVRECLEYSWFKKRVAKCQDFPADPQAATSMHAPHEIDLTRAIDQEPPLECLRFCGIEVLESIDLLRAQSADQIGRLLWPVLERKAVATVPGDFVRRHLIIDRDSAMVWNRRGIAIAFKGEAGAAQSRQLESTVKKMAGVRLEVKQILEAGDSTPNEDALVRSEQLARSLAEIRLDSAQPERTALRRFFEANHFDDVLAIARSLHQQAVERARREREMAATGRMDENLHTIAHVQTMVEWIEIFLVSVYAGELAHALVPAPEDAWPYSHLVVASAAVTGAALTAWGVLPTVRQKISVSAIAFLAFLGVAAFLHPANKWIEDGAKSFHHAWSSGFGLTTDGLIIAFRGVWFALVRDSFFGWCGGCEPPGEMLGTATKTKTLNPLVTRATASKTASPLPGEVILDSPGWLARSSLPPRHRHLWLVQFSSYSAGKSLRKAAADRCKSKIRQSLRPAAAAGCQAHE